MTLVISSALCGQSMMVCCWWAHSPNFKEIAHGVWCWPGYRCISTGAVMMRPIACHRCWAPRTVRSGLRHCGERAASALHEAGGDEHSGQGGGPEAAHDATPRCQLRRLGMHIHMAHPPTCL